MKKSWILIFVCSAFLFSCATTDQPTVMTDPNEKSPGRGLQYTCRVGNGDIIVTTDNAVAKSAEHKKSSAFIEKTTYKPVDITDYDPEHNHAREGELRYLEDVLIDKLVQETMDWKFGTARSLSVDAEAQVDLPSNERMIQMIRTKTNPKTILYDKGVFSRVTGSNPAVGEAVRLHHGVIGEVVSIEGNAVRVVFAPKSDHPMDGPFGPVVVKDKGDHFQIEIDAEKGTLVNVGPAVGQISEVNERNFRIDYTHPFGGETLQCDVEITEIVRSVQGTNKLVKQDTPQTENIDKPGVSSMDDPTRDLPAEADGSLMVETGDLVKVDYTAVLQSNGALVHTTLHDIANDPGQETIQGYRAPEVFEPDTVIAGGQETFPGLGYAVMGLVMGDRRKVVVPSEKVFGKRNPHLVKQFDRNKMTPTRVTMPAKEYIKRFDGFPVKGRTIQYNPYIVGKIVDVVEKGAVLELAPADKEMDSEFGLTRMTVIGDEIHIFLIPKLGGYFEFEKRSGRVVAVDDRKFTVDFNEPLAGENMVLDLKVVSLTKADTFSGMDIEWIEDHDVGLYIAENEKKGVVLVLYADWCGYSKKLFNQTIEDPRIKMMKDDFVWIKVDSDMDKEFKEYYGQKGFPMTVLLDEEGRVIGKIKGFRPPGEYQAEIRKAFQEMGLKAGSATERTGNRLIEDPAGS